MGWSSRALSAERDGIGIVGVAQHCHVVLACKEMWPSAEPSQLHSGYLHVS